MLAFLTGDRTHDGGMRRRVGASLGLFAGFEVPAWLGIDRMAWQLPRCGTLPPKPRRKSVAARLGVVPAQLPTGVCAQVHGWIDNCAELAAELGCPAHDQAVVFTHAVRAWGDTAEQRVLGAFCTVYHDPAVPGLRLSRSAIYGPPLYYMVDERGVGAASVPRVLEAMGLPRELNRQRIADSLFFNYNDDESYLRGCFKVPLNAVVHVAPPARRDVRRHFDARTIGPLPMASAEDYIAEADRLLEQAAQIYGASARNPGVFLSGGLDSPNVAARLLRGWPEGKRLPSFTFVPLNGHGQPEIAGTIVDEEAAVRAFAELHPALDPHFIDNRGIEFDHRLEEMFLAMGTGTPNLAALFRYHGLFAAARDAGCDMVLTADFGGLTFSSQGKWGYAEYLRRGKFGALIEALRAAEGPSNSLVWRFLALAVAPMLPDPVWRAAMRLRGKHIASANHTVSAMRGDALEEFAVEQRAARAGTLYERPLAGWRSDLVTDNYQRGDVEGADILQAWEQLYEVSTRDPPSYRPFVEFCLGLPTEMFLRDGQTRWLARQLGRGLMPEAQRLMPGHGVQAADWHLRLTPRRDDMRREVEAIARDPVLSGIIDTDMLTANIENWPAAQSVEDSVYFPHAFRLPRAIAMGRYVRFMTGQNSA